jgi:hypothetical protein
MLRFSSALLAAGLAAALLAPSAASAKTKHRVHHYARATEYYHPSRVIYDTSRPILEVNRRSWLDPGPVVPQGTEQHYVQAQTILNTNPNSGYTERLGYRPLPGPFDIPGRQEPVVEFWTPRAY